MSSDSPTPSPSHGAPGRGARLAGAARTPVGAGALVIVALAVLIAVTGLLGGASRPGARVAAASPTASAALVTGSPSPSASPLASSATGGPSASAGPVASLSPTPASPPPTASPSPSPKPTPDLTGVPADALQARLERIRARLAIPGVSVAILWDDGRRWLGVSGLRDVKGGDPMTTGTAFALASVSKTLTAAVVLQLVDEGRLSLDQRVAVLLPAYPVNPKVTVRQLLDHTSGIPDFFLNGKIDRPLQSDKDARWTPAQTWKYVAPLHKRFRPGRVWMYSNSNYLLLGELVEAVTGRPLHAVIRSRLLDPLGLESAWYQDEERPRAPGTVAYRLVTKSGGPPRAVPVAPRTDVMPFRSVVTAAAGAGSIAATAADAARWMRAFAGGDLLSPALQRQVVGDVVATSRLHAKVPYGLGIQAVPIAGRYALGHSGRFLGIRNVVRYLPVEGITIAVLTNQGVKDPSRIAEGLLKLVLPPPTKPVSAPSPSVAPSPSGAPSPNP